MLFLTPTRKMIPKKFVKLERFLEVCWGHFIFNVKRVEVPKMREMF